MRVDLLIGSLPKRIAIRLEQFVDLLGLLVCFVMVWYGGAAVIDAYQAGFIRFRKSDRAGLGASASDLDRLGVACR